MKFIIIALSLCLSCICSAQSPGGGIPLKADGNNDSKLDKKPGIRFVLRNQEGALPGDAYLHIEGTKSVPVDLRLGLPGRRVNFPKGNRIRIFDQEPTAEMLKKGMKPLLDAPVPVGMGPKVIGLVGYGKNGYDVQFIDETEMRPGLVYFINLTNKNYLIDVPKAPGSEPKRFELNAGAQYVFGKAINGGAPDSIPYRVYHQLVVNGKPQWIVERRSLMGIGKTRASIFLFMPDSFGTSMITHEIMVYK